MRRRFVAWACNGFRIALSDRRDLRPQEHRPVKKPNPQSGPADRSAMMAFERYYAWADTMRQQVTGLYDPEPRTHWQPYMAYWYGGLNAVVDG
jgi:hypothetical protein